MMVRRQRGMQSTGSGGGRAVEDGGHRGCQGGPPWRAVVGNRRALDVGVCGAGLGVGMGEGPVRLDWGELLGMLMGSW